MFFNPRDEGDGAGRLANFFMCSNSELTLNKTQAPAGTELRGGVVVEAEVGCLS